MRPIDVRPATSGADAYNARGNVAAPSDELTSAMVEVVGDVAEGAGYPRPVADGRMFAVARELARVAARNEQMLPYPVVEFAMRYHGIIEPSPHLLITQTSHAEPHPELLDKVRESVARAFGDGVVSRVGVGYVKAADPADGFVLVLALQSSFVETAPIPRALGRNEVIEIRGRVLPPYREPHVFVTRDDGTVVDVRVRTGARGGIEADVPCAGRRGAQRIEIAASDRTGSNVLANFPVYCGESPPERFSYEPDENARPVADAGEAETVMLELVNRDRKRVGLAPLVNHPRLAEIARAHSKDMRETGVVAHVSPTTGSAADRVEAGGVRTVLVLENVARAYGVYESQQGLMESPGHRANLLSPEATHIGIGIVVGSEGVDPGQPEMFVTQLFIRAPQKVDVGRTRKDLERRLASDSGMKNDGELAAVAQEFATRVATGMSSKRAQAKASEQLDDIGSRYQRIVTTVTALADPVQFSSAQFTERGTTHFGLGLAQGKHDELGEHALFLVILLATER